MSQSYQEGMARVDVAVEAAVVAIDRVTEGAASSFVRQGRATLKQIQTAAEARWPVRTGLSRRSLTIATSITPDLLAVSMRNTATNRWGSYAYKIRWSVRTEAELTRELEAKVQRGATPAAQAALARYWQRRIQGVHGQGAPSAELAGKQPWRVLVLAPGEQRRMALADALRADLSKLAGGG